MEKIEMKDRKIRVLVAKPGLDGHDRGAKVIAKGLSDEGFEVVYTGLRQTPEQIISAAIEEDADIVGLSILSGAHLSLTRRVLEGLRLQGAENIRLVVGGIIPAFDIPKLKEMGVARVYLTGSPLKAIAEDLRSLMGTKKD